MVDSNKIFTTPNPVSRKYNLRLRLVPLITIALNKLGVSWKKLGELFGREVLIGQANILEKRISAREKNIDPLDVIFLTMIGGNTHNISIDIILAWKLKYRGHKVRIIIDDQFLPITEVHKPGQEHLMKEVSAREYAFGLAYAKAAGLEILQVSDLIKEANWQNEKISIFDHVLEASLLKHYKVGIIEPSLPSIEEKKSLFSKSIKITSILGKKLVRMNPDLVIMSHGIYSTWGPPFHHLKKNEIPIVTYGRGKKMKTQKFNWNCTSDWWEVGEEWENIKDIPLSEEENTKIDDYLKSRIDHSNDVLVYNFGKLEDRESTLSRFNLEEGKPTFGLFTNVLWDAASAQREIVFKNSIEWVIETINWFRENPDKQLIVKIHPAEIVIGTNMPFFKILEENLESIPKNVRIIRPEEKVNSWSIYKVIQLGIVHTTTVGMELPLLGIPCIVVSKTHFRDKGFTVDLSNKQEYFSYLKEFGLKTIDQIQKENLRKQSKKYAYLLFERYQIPFNVFNEYGSLNVKSLSYENFTQFLEDPSTNFIVDAIEQKKAFIL